MRGVPPTLKKIWLDEEEKYFTKDPDSEFHLRHGERMDSKILSDPENENLYYFRPKHAAALALNRAIVTSIQLGMPLVTDNLHFQEAQSYSYP